MHEFSDLNEKRYVHATKKVRGGREGGVLVLEQSDDHGKSVREATPAFRAFPRFEKKLVHLGHTRLT